MRTSRERLLPVDKQMRSTADLIEELKRETKTDNYVFLALVVGFDKASDFVWSTDPEPLNKLDTFLQQGGKPIGFIGRTRTHGGMVRPVTEAEREQWAQQYLTALAASFAARLETKGLARAANPKN